MPPESKPASTPLFPEIGVIGLTPEAWGDIPKVRHAVMSRLARYFHVVWMNPPRHWRSSWKGRKVDAEPTRPWPAGSFQLYQAGKWLPLVHTAPAGRVFDLLRLRQAARLARRAGARRLALYLWRPEFLWAAKAMPEAITCYHVDDETSFSTVERPVQRREAELLKRSDVTFIHSPGLWDRKASLARNPVRAPNGVNFAVYANPQAEPADLRAIGHPRIGYVGVIRLFLDLPLLLELARLHPAWSFVFVGPTRVLQEDLSAYQEMRSLPNVHFLGHRPKETLAAYTQHLDVGIMPYDVDDYTKYIYPLKLHEYLAAGLPTVGTNIRTLRDFADVVTIATGAAEWSAALEAALSPAAHSREAIAARHRVAQAHDWDLLVHRIAVTIAGQFGIDADDERLGAPPMSTRAIR